MKRMVLTVALIAAAIALAACGSSSKKGTTASTSSGQAGKPAQTTATQPSSPASHTVSLSADPSGALRFTTNQATAKSGAVTLKFTNPSSVAHGLSLQGPGANVNGKVIDSGQSSTVTLTLKPGHYTFYCPVPGHRAAGMQGTLVVQ